MELKNLLLDVFIENYAFHEDWNSAIQCIVDNLNAKVSELKCGSASLQHFDFQLVSIELSKYFDIEKLQQDYEKFQKMEVEEKEEPDLLLIPEPIQIDYSTDDDASMVEDERKKQKSVSATGKVTRKSAKSKSSATPTETAAATPTERKPSRRKDL